LRGGWCRGRPSPEPSAISCRSDIALLSLSMMSARPPQEVDPIVDPSPAGRSVPAMGGTRGRRLRPGRPAGVGRLPRCPSGWSLPGCSRPARSTSAVECGLRRLAYSCQITRQPEGVTDPATCCWSGANRLLG
jgi:hypothetical protein